MEYAEKLFVDLIVRELLKELVEILGNGLLLVDVFLFPPKVGRTRLFALW